jgi:hypothetical protein
VIYVFNFVKVCIFYSSKMVEGECVLSLGGFWGWLDEVMFGTVDVVTQIAVVVFFCSNSLSGWTHEVIKRLMYLSAVTCAVTIMAIVINIHLPAYGLHASNVDLITDMITMMKLYSLAKPTKPRASRLAPPVREEPRSLPNFKVSLNLPQINEKNAKAHPPSLNESAHTAPTSDSATSNINLVSWVGNTVEVTVTSPADSMSDSNALSNQKQEESQQHAEQEQKRDEAYSVYADVAAEAAMALLKNTTETETTSTTPTTNHDPSYAWLNTLT